MSDLLYKLKQLCPGDDYGNTPCGTCNYCRARALIETFRERDRQREKEKLKTADTGPR